MGRFHSSCPERAPSQLAVGEASPRGKAQAPIRVAVMGRTRGLPLFDSLAVLGREETRRRLAAALDQLAPAG